MQKDYFSTDYSSARIAFRRASAAAGAALSEHRISAMGPAGESLSIDVARLGEDSAAAVLIVSSGVHGVEGLFGSAVQLAWLDSLRNRPPPTGLRIVLLHAVNPFGFAWRRRWDEDGVDLNRNFLHEGEQYCGSPPLYKSIDPVVNPASPPGGLDLFPLRAALLIARHGMQALRETLPVGQHDFPGGLFYGGAAASESHRIMAAELPALAGGASRVIHLDFHTGLGRWKTHQLLVDASPGAPRTKRLIGIFGAERISAGRPSIGLPDRAGIYRTRGTWDRWCSQRFSHIAYDYACAEFGTYGPLAIIAALRAENRAWRHVPLAERHRYERVWRRVCEVFCPADAGWREQALADGVAICELARERLP